MYVLNIVLALAIFAMATTRWRRAGFSFTSPAGLLALIWGVIWAIHALDVFGYFEVSLTAQVMSLLPVIFLFLGEQLGMARQSAGAVSPHDPEKLRRLLRYNLWAAVFFAFAGLVAVAFIFGNPLAAGVGEDIKNARVIVGSAAVREGPLGIIAQYSAIARSFLYFAFMSLVIVWFKDRPAAMRFGLLLLLATIVSDVSRGSRATILDFAVFIFATAALVRRGGGRTVARRGKRVAIVAVVVLIGLGVLADNITRSTRPDRSAEIRGVEVPLSVYQLFQYYSSTLVTFDQTLESTTYRTHGLMSGGGVLAVLSIFRIYRNPDLEVYELMRDWEDENPYFRDENYLDRGNLYSWLRYFYVDFGWAGLCLMPFLVGWVGGRAAGRLSTVSNGAVIDFVLVGTAFYIVARSPLVFVLRDETLLIAMALAYAVHRATRLPRRRPAATSEQAAVPVLADLPERRD